MDGSNDFERTLGLYGTCTGTVPSGISLIRIVDPDLETPTCVELGACNLVMLVFIPVYMIILAFASGYLAMNLAMMLLVLCALIYLAILKLTNPGVKKRIVGRDRLRRIVVEKLYYNGKIITMAGCSTGVMPEAVLINDGRIQEVGSMDLLREKASANTEWVDLQGRCLMPSFIDSHSHIVMNGQMSCFADLSGCESFEDILSVLKEYMTAQNMGKDDVVLGYGYDHNFLKERCHPDKRILDKVSKEVPIMILHVSAHLGCINSAALALAGVNAETEDPKGGIIGRLNGSREPSGYVEEAGLAIVQSAIQNRMHLDITAVMANMQKVYIENGITTAQDGASTATDLLLLKQMADSQQLKIDVVAYPLIAANGAEIMDNYKKFDGTYENHLKIGGYKMILDGSPQGRSAWLSEPYIGERDGYRGYPAMDDCTVRKYVMQTITERRQLLAHCNGDEASEQFLNIYEECMADVGKGVELRPVMIHCQTVRNDQLDRMAKMHMIASIFIGHVWYWGDIHLKNLGMERGNHISPVKDAMDRGVIVDFHQDAPVTKPDMLHSVWCAVNRISRNGHVIGEEQKITAYEALKAVTINAAYQYFEEKEKGSIEVGKRAAE